MPVSAARFDVHPLYRNQAKIALVTDALLASGHSVFQIFQRYPDEAAHSEWLLSLADPEEKARTVLSLGCGVGGMEAYWHASRPELEFTLVNIAQAQLDRCLCAGRTVCANAETYIDKEQFDLVVICYLLGHVRVDITLLSALGNLKRGGNLLIYDIFDGSEKFCDTWFYDTPALSTIEIFGTANGLRFRTVFQGGIPYGDFFQDSGLYTAVDAMPALFVFQKP
jgi:SAM-dependent methyltransferase